MKLSEEETISLDDAADTISYLATVHLPGGVGDETVARNLVPRGKFLWHDLTPMNCGFEDDARLKISQQKNKIFEVSSPKKKFEDKHLVAISILHASAVKFPKACL